MFVTPFCKIQQCKTHLLIWTPRWCEEKQHSAGTRLDLTQLKANEEGPYCCSAQVITHIHTHTHAHCSFLLLYHTFKQGERILNITMISIIWRSILVFCGAQGICLLLIRTTITWLARPRAVSFISGRIRATAFGKVRALSQRKLVSIQILMMMIFICDVFVVHHRCLSRNKSIWSSRYLPI